MHNPAVQHYLAEQTQRLVRCDIDRRQFVLSALAAGVTLPAALGMADQALAATPKSGGKLHIGTGHGSTTDNLDPSTAENGLMQAIIYARGNHLMEIDSNGVLIPELAESAEPADGGKTWIFQLRKGIEFHNGKSLSADDVIATFHYHSNAESKSAAKGLVEQITAMRKDGDHRVIFELEAANADFPYISSDYHLMILPSENGVVDATSGVGTGGYVLENFEPGVRARFKRNPNYFKTGRAHFDEVEMLSILDVTARQNAVLNGDVDHIDRVATKTVSLLGRAPHLRIIETTGGLHYTAPMRLDTAPFGNYDLRMALKLSIKRQEMVDKILHGHGTMGNDLPFSPAIPFYNTDIPQREFDPEKAAYHYKKSGHSGTIELSSSDAAFDGAVSAAELLASSASEVGIDVKVVREPKDGYWSNVWNKKGWCFCYWGGRETQDKMYSSAYTAEAKWNDTAWRGTEASKRFNEVVRLARGETDMTKRQALYFEAQTLLHDDSGAIVAMLANHIHATSKKVATPEKIAANWENDGNKAAERWWFA